MPTQKINENQKNKNQLIVKKKRKFNTSIKPHGTLS